MYNSSIYECAYIKRLNSVCVLLHILSSLCSFIAISYTSSVPIRLKTTLNIVFVILWVSIRSKLYSYLIIVLICPNDSSKDMNARKVGELNDFMFARLMRGLPESDVFSLSDDCCVDVEGFESIFQFSLSHTQNLFYCLVSYQQLYFTVFSLVVSTINRFETAMKIFPFVAIYNTIKKI